MTTPASPPAAWYPDPHDTAQLRWWDGGRWTEHVEPRPTTAAVAPGFPAAGPVAPTAATAVVPQVAATNAWSPQQPGWSAAAAVTAPASAGAAAAGASYAPASTVGGYAPASTMGGYAPASTVGGYAPGAFGGVPANPAPWGGTPTAPGAAWAAPVDASNRFATWALVAGVVVLVVLLFTPYVVASGLAIWVGAKGVARARAIKRAGHPTAVGMARSVVGLCLSIGGALLYLLTVVLEISLAM